MGVNCDWVRALALIAVVSIVTAFQQFPDKDCMLLSLREGCSRPWIANGFRSVRGDAHMTTIARMSQTQAGESPTAVIKGHSVATLNSNNVVLYALHRNEVMFLNGGAYLLELESDQVRSATPVVVVKGLGLRGIGRSIKAWTSGFFGSGRSKRISSKRSNRVRSKSSDPRP